MKQSILLIVGFTLFALGLLSFFLTATGMQFIFMKWVNALFGTWSYLVFLIIAGVGIGIFFNATIPQRYQTKPKD